MSIYIQILFYIYISRYSTDYSLFTNLYHIQFISNSYVKNINVSYSLDFKGHLKSLLIHITIYQHNIKHYKHLFLKFKTNTLNRTTFKME